MDWFCVVSVGYMFFWATLRFIFALKRKCKF